MSGVVGIHSWMSGNGRKTLPYVREWSGGLPKCPGVVERLFLMSGSCREAIPEVWETLPDVPEWWEFLPDAREWSGGPP